MLNDKDILHGDHPSYGFLNWNFYTIFIPSHVRYTYILSEPLNYIHHSETASDICSKLSIALIDFLRLAYPLATVGIRRGYPYQGWIQLTKAETVVCAPSSFCSFPALSRTFGNVYFQIGDQLFNGTGDFGKHFHWIQLPPTIRLIHNHKQLVKKKDIN